MLGVALPFGLATPTFIIEPRKTGACNEMQAPEFSLTRQKYVPRLLAPEGSEHGDDLLLPGHDLGQKQVIVFGNHGEGLLNNIVAAHI